MATIRKASCADLDMINRVIERAITTWNLPDRVKRLSLSSYLYRQSDLQTMEIIVAENNDYSIAGVAAWEQAEAKETPEGSTALLLHGIFVDPECQHQGIGKQLLRAAEHRALERGYTVLLVKAQASAAKFFIAHGMQPVKIMNEKRDYAHRYWKQLT